MRYVGILGGAIVSSAIVGSAIVSSAIVGRAIVGRAILSTCYLVITPTQVHLGLRSGATATLVNGRVSSSYEHRLGETRSICNREST